VLDGYLNFTQDKTEWTGTDITFDISKKGDQTEVRFTHVGLVPEFECFDNCSNAWGLNRPGNCGDSFAWKGKSNVHTEEEANAAGEEAAAVRCPAQVSA
jgi:hypothetical protein